MSKKNKKLQDKLDQEAVVIENETSSNDEAELIESDAIVINPIDLDKELKQSSEIIDAKKIIANVEEGDAVQTAGPSQYHPLEVIGLTKKYPRSRRTAISNLNFTVKEGEFHAFIGANGAGKTTTIKCLVGAYAKFKGRVNFYGQKNTTKKAKLYLGYIPEIGRFPMNMTLKDYLVIMSQLSGKKAKEAKKIIDATLKQIDL
jgi:ABC-type transport system involved in cytochrome bd biosynthesis fused ATPase/permease subunit